jgi:hypothetical protein
MSAMKVLRALTIPLLAVACSAPTAEDLDVHGVIDKAAFALTKAPAPRMTGSWSLNLSLGNLASSYSDVSQVQFQLTEANGLAAPVPLVLGASQTTAGRVDIGKTWIIEYNYDSAGSGGMQLSPDQATSLCAGTWRVDGSFYDGARNKTTPIVGPSVKVACL